MISSAAAPGSAALLDDTPPGSEAMDDTPPGSDFGDTDDEADEASPDAAAGAGDESSSDGDDELEVVAEFEAAAAAAGAGREAHVALLAALRAGAARGGAAWARAVGAAWLRYRGLHALGAGEWLACARDLEGLGDGAGALAALEAAVAERPAEPQLWLELARVAFGASGAAGARAALRRACDEAGRDASGGLGRLFDARRALEADLGDEAGVAAAWRDQLGRNQIFNPTSMWAYSNSSTLALRLCFENSMRAIDPSKNQPNRRRFDRAREG